MASGDHYRESSSGLRPTELSVISLARPVETPHGLLPPGAAGTVVHVYPGQVAYEVEFTKPFHLIATVEAGAIKGWAAGGCQTRPER